MTKVASIVDVLQGKIAIGETVTVRGWIRTRRDSKAGLSFLAIYDGSCFDPIQAIVNNDIENYETESVAFNNRLFCCCNRYCCRISC